MTLMKSFNKIRTVAICMFIFSVALVQAQTILYQENFGNPASNTLIQDYTGWENSHVLYTGNGTCDVRSSSASNGYGGASGAGNVMINDTVKWFQVSGINTAADTNISLYCGLRKTNAENGTNFVVEVSADSLSWTRLAMEGDTLPSGTGTSGWHRVRYLHVISCPNLHLRFSNLAQVDYRLDDIALVVGMENTLETVGKPTFSPGGGTYYEPQTVTLSSQTANASIFYTMDGSTPTPSSNPYLGPLTINNSVTIKAMAIHDDMYDSEVASASYVILDTNSLVHLPLDLSNNSEVEKLDITHLPGFRGYHLGASYADGSAKFESTHAGEAILSAHLDSAPGTLTFELKGRTGGSNPAAYEGVQMELAESPDGQQWHPLAVLTENDISTDGYVRFTGYTLMQTTRYVRWKLLSSSKGNTQLNNITISQYSGGGSDSVPVISYDLPQVCVYPNPTSGLVSIIASSAHVEEVVLTDLRGNVLYRWSMPIGNIDMSLFPRGMYIMSVHTSQGVVKKKVVRY